MLRCFRLPTSGIAIRLKTLALLGLLFLGCATSRKPSAMSIDPAKMSHKQLVEWLENKMFIGRDLSEVASEIKKCGFRESEPIVGKLVIQATPTSEKIDHGRVLHQKFYRNDQMGTDLVEKATSIILLIEDDRVSNVFVSEQFTGT